MAGEVNIDDLEALAFAAKEQWGSPTPTMVLRHYHEATNPQIVLDLIARVRRSEAYTIDVEGCTASSGVDGECGTHMLPLLAHRVNNVPRCAHHGLSVLDYLQKASSVTEPV